MEAMFARAKKLLEPEWVAQSVAKPVAVFHGTADMINEHSASVDYVKLLNSLVNPEKGGWATLFSYRHYFHDLFLEIPERSEKVLNDFKEWLLAHSSMDGTQMTSSELLAQHMSYASTLQTNLVKKPSFASATSDSDKYSLAVKPIVPLGPGQKYERSTDMFSSNFDGTYTGRPISRQNSSNSSDKSQYGHQYAHSRQISQLHRSQGSGTSSQKSSSSNDDSRTASLLLQHLNYSTAGTSSMSTNHKIGSKPITLDDFF